MHCLFCDKSFDDITQTSAFCSLECAEDYSNGEQQYSNDKYYYHGSDEEELDIFNRRNLPE